MTPSQQLQQHKKENFINFYRETRGHISDTCRAVEINRTTYYNWLEGDENFRKQIMDAEMELNDDVRKALIDKIADGDMTGIIFYLKHRHPDFKEQPAIIQQFNIGKEMVVDFVKDENIQITSGAT